MALNFIEQKLSGRCKQTCAKMAGRELDGLWICHHDRMCYLSGYDTFGYVYFQCLFLSTDEVLDALGLLAGSGAFEGGHRAARFGKPYQRGIRCPRNSSRLARTDRTQAQFLWVFTGLSPCSQMEGVIDTLS
jgi:hypothetical protein